MFISFLLNLAVIHNLKFQSEEIFCYFSNENNNSYIDCVQNMQILIYAVYITNFIFLDKNN